MRALISKAKFKLGLLGFKILPFQMTPSSPARARSPLQVKQVKFSASSAILASDTTGAGFLGGAFTCPRDVWFRVRLTFATGAAQFRRRFVSWRALAAYFSADSSF